MYLFFQPGLQPWDTGRLTRKSSRCVRGTKRPQPASTPSRHRLGSLLTIAVAASSWFAQASLGQTSTTRIAVGPGIGQVTQAAPTSPDSLKGGATLDVTPLGIFGPGVIATDPQGNVYVAVRDGVFRIDPWGTRSRVAGIERNWRFSGDGGPAIQAGLNPLGVTVDSAGNLYLADTGNNRIRRVAVASGIITTVAGDGVRGFSGDGGPATSAHLDGPTGVTLDTAGDLYIADGTGDGRMRIRKVAAATEVISTVAGNGSQGYSGDGGPATLAQLSTLGGLAADPSGNLFIADNFNHRIRMVSAATGIITTVAGTGGVGHFGGGGVAADAELNNPLSVAVDPAGSLYIADSGNYRVRRVTLATGAIATAGDGAVVFPDTQHGFPCALSVDGAGNLYIADSGISRIRRVPADLARQSAGEADPSANPDARSFATTGGFKINVTYDPSVPAAAQAAFNAVVSTYESIYTTNITVNINVAFGSTGLGESATQEQLFSYTTWRAAMIANAVANPGNTYAAAAAATLPATDPIGDDVVFVVIANARALGLSANAAVDSTLTFSNSVIFEYNGVPVSGAADFMDVAAHELDEGLCIDSALTGLADNAPLPPGGYRPEDYFRYSGPGTRSVTTNPNAVVYFSYDSGNTLLAQFNQDSGLDRNDWIYANFGCPAATPHVQDAIGCFGQAVAIGMAPETTVLSALGYDSNISPTITFAGPGNVTIGVAPFALNATASSGLPVTFTATTLVVCTVSGSTVTILAVGACLITASQPGNAPYSAPSVTRSFTVMQEAPPAAPALTAPANAATGVSLTPTLSWTASSSATSYDVYFGISPTPPLATSTTAASLGLGALTEGTTYYWQVAGRNAGGSTRSAIGSFTTQAFLAGPANFIVKFANSSTLMGSAIFELSGLVGISTAVPAISLDVRTGSLPQMGVAGVTDYLTFFASDIFGPAIYWDPAKDMRFGKGGAGLYNPYGFVEQMRIQSSTGNVGIGTMGPGFKLDAAGDVNFTGSLRYQASLVLQLPGDGSSNNLALGLGALANRTTGTNNIAIGRLAASFVSGGNSSNIHIGSLGLSSDRNTIRMGSPGTQSSSFVAGVRGVTTKNVGAIEVLIDSAGQLGTTSSSRRFKEDICDMGGASLDLLRLQPVTFRYKQPFADGLKPIQYGLIAEDVAKVFPDLAAHSADGQIETVKYQVLRPMLLNGLRLQQAEIRRLKEEVDQQQEDESLQERLTRMEAALASMSSPKKSSSVQ